MMYNGSFIGFEFSLFVLSDIYFMFPSVWSQFCNTYKDYANID